MISRAPHYHGCSLHRFVQVKASDIYVHEDPTDLHMDRRLPESNLGVWGFTQNSYQNSYVALHFGASYSLNPKP